MKEYKLKESDYGEIFSAAHRSFIDKSGKDTSYFHVRCIVDSFIMFINKNKLVIVNGKLYEKTDEQSK